MSIHGSLGKASSLERHRSVIKRHERLKTLEEKGGWAVGKGVLGLPKVKLLKIKAKKEKAKAEGTTEKPAEPGATGAAPAAAAAQAALKPAAKPEAEKKQAK